LSPSSRSSSCADSRPASRPRAGPAVIGCLYRRL
jgi:hypothetical protein